MRGPKWVHETRGGSGREMITCESAVGKYKRKHLHMKWTISSPDEEPYNPPCIKSRWTKKGMSLVSLLFPSSQMKTFCRLAHSTILNIHHFHSSTSIFEVRTYVRSKGVKSTFPVLVTANTSFPIISKEVFTSNFTCVHSMCMCTRGV